tara:strand:+ start:486 stop:3164 length:2679 start_codon:yes stop_codon:yes gene_type:complete
MAAVTQRISNYLSGVSKQPDSKKLPGQVRECINGLADVTLGMTKRPGFKFISKLKTTGGADFTGTQLDGAKWFYINRDADRYVGCITPKVGNTNGSVYIWNADTGVACTVTNGSQHAYLTGVESNYDVLSVQANTIICNDTVTVTTQAAPTDFIAASRGTVLLSGTAEQMFSQSWSITFKDTANSVNETATYTSGASDKFDDILDGLETALNGKNITGLTVTKYGTSLQLDYVLSNTRTPFTLSAEGGFDNERLVVFQDWASNASYLPPNSFHNHVVEIVNSVNTDIDNYFAKFVADNSAAGSGYWKETLDPQASAGLTAATMPYRLRNTGSNAFILETIPWVDRLVGDDDTAPHPSFVGKTIKRTFYHDDRLGFLSEDNVIFSKAKSPFDLYVASARTLTAGDPIDVNVASVRPTKLHAVLPARQGLTLFSKNAQFLIYSDDGPLTPVSTKIRPISNMEMSDEVDPIDVGTHMNFISKTPNFVRVFAMTTRGLGENPDILDIGRVVNEWITIDVDTLIPSIQNEFIAMSSQNSDEIFFYKTYTDGKELLMESWFKWKLPGTVQNMAIDQDDMYCITKQGNQYVLSDANLTQSPEAAIITNADGQKINPCIDFYTPASNGLTGGSLKTVVYDSANLRSKCYIPFANLTDRKNIVLVAGTTAAGTYNNSGYTVTAEVGTDSDGTFFIVEGLDLSNNAANVYVGYAYDFDLTLPQIYYQLDQEGKSTDFTSSLTIARLKFDLGLSGLLSFKLNSTGRFAGKREYTGDGTTTDFNWVAGDLNPIDRNQVKVKINNVTNTAFTFLNDTEIRFNSAPANGDSILIYLDEWYELAPSQMANEYLADDVPLDESRVVTIPIHQRSKNFKLRVFNDSPFPVSLNSMMWEGNYSPRFYRRT